MAQKTTPHLGPSSDRGERLEGFVRDHSQRFIQALLEEEVTALVGRPTSARRAVVDAAAGRRNGEGKPRRLRGTAGPLTVRRPRGRGLAERCGSRGLPLFQRRTREVGERVPTLSLHGWALGDCDLAGRGLLGDAAPFSVASRARLNTGWPLEDEAWKQRRLDDLAVVSLWAAGRSVKAGLEDTKAALLVMIGALTDGQQGVLAGESGPRESTEAWGAVWRDRRLRGLTPWRCPVAAGHLGSWAALAEPQPTAAEHRCWHHRITNVLAAIPQKPQAQARTRLCARPSAESQAACERLRAPFDTRYRHLAPKAVDRRADDGDRVVTFDQFPRDPGRHVRTTHVVASPVATARRRPGAAKRGKKVDSATALIWKRRQVAAPPFRRLKAPELLPAVYAGAKYADGIQPHVRTHQEVAA